MASPSADAPTEARLGLEWELWVVEKLTEGASRDAVIDTLVDEGLDRARAIEKIDEILRSPSYARLLRRAARTAMAENILLARRSLGEPITSIASVPAIDRATFQRDYWERSRPLHLTEAVRPMRAVREWTLETLARDYGHVEVEVNVRRDRAKRRALTATKDCP